MTYLRCKLQIKCLNICSLGYSYLHPANVNIIPNMNLKSNISLWYFFADIFWHCINNVFLDRNLRYWNSFQLSKKNPFVKQSSEKSNCSMKAFPTVIHFTHKIIWEVKLQNGMVHKQLFYIKEKGKTLINLKVDKCEILHDINKLHRLYESSKTR